MSTTGLQSASASGAALAMRRHWPEYLIEAWALGMFMIAAGTVGALLESPLSSLNRALPEVGLRLVLGGIAMGLTAIALIYSPWGKRSGAHMNPAVTLTFLRLGHVARWDAIFYIVAQFVGGTLGVLLVLVVLGDLFSQPPVSYVATVPGKHGIVVALIAEGLISFLMMTMILRVSNSQRYMKYTGLCAGLLVATFISLEAPLSGMSMNPARSFASALPGNIWTGFWIYLIAPLVGMQAAAALHVWRRGRESVRCAKLMHTSDQRCIHCGYEPSGAPAAPALALPRGAGEGKDSASALSSLSRAAPPPGGRGSPSSGAPSP